MPWPVIFANSACWRVSSPASMHRSASPKLWERTSAWVVARLSEIHCVALRMSASSFDFAMTSRIFAPGATACAHETSSVVSPAQPAPLAAEVESIPNGATTCRFTAGSPHNASKVERSEFNVGLPYASTIAIVRPLPS